MRTRHPDDEAIFPDLILMADVHLREDRPECWPEDTDVMAVQKQVWDWIREMQNVTQAPVVIAGDIFNKAKSSPFLESWAVDNLPSGPVYVIPGQHDLPEHSMAQFNRSSLNVLVRTGRVMLLSGWQRLNDWNVYGAGWEEDMEAVGWHHVQGGHNLAVIHTMVYQGKAPFPGCTAPSASRLLKKLPDFDAVLTGDNHLPFVESTPKQVLVNPGSLLPTTAAQQSHEPRVYLLRWDEKPVVEAVFSPVDGEMLVSREHVEKEKRRNERVEAFVKKLRKDVELGLDFQQNIKEYLSAHPVSPEVEAYVWQSIGG